jgi:hypothetical protein
LVALPESLVRHEKGALLQWESVKKSGVADQCRLEGCLLRFLLND